MAPSTLPKHSLVIDGRRTSVSLEGAFWAHFRAAAKVRDQSLNELASEIAGLYKAGTIAGAVNLSSAIRLWLLTSEQEAEPNEQ